MTRRLRSLRVMGCGDDAATASRLSGMTVLSERDDERCMREYPFRNKSASITLRETMERSPSQHVAVHPYLQVVRYLILFCRIKRRRHDSARNRTAMMIWK